MGLRSSPLPRIGAMAGAAFCIASCSTLSPQIFSDNLLSPQTGATVTLKQARANASQAAARYVSAVHEQSAIGPSIGAGLLGLTALALINSLNHSSGTKLAAIGIAGSATYLYGSTLVSRERQKVYLEGARALNCAVLATTSAAKWEDTQAHSRAKVEAMDTDLAALSATVTRYAYLDRQSVTTARGGARPPGCEPARRPSSCELPNARPEERAVHEAACARARSEWDRLCAPSPALTRIEEPNPIVTATMDAAREELARAGLLSAQFAQASPIAAATAERLELASLNIQVAVSAEVRRTEPDLAAILAATRGLGAGASTVPAAKVPKAPARLEGASAGSAVTVRPLDSVAQEAVREIGERTASLLTSRKALERGPGADLTGVIDTPAKLQACVFTSPLAPATPTAPAAQPGAAQPPALQPAAASEISPAPTTDDLKRLGLRPDAPQAQVTQAIIACQKRLQRPSPPTGDFDAGTRDAVREGTACQNIAAKG